MTQFKLVKASSLNPRLAKPDTNSSDVSWKEDGRQLDALKEHQRLLRRLMEHRYSFKQLTQVSSEGIIRQRHNNLLFSRDIQDTEITREVKRTW